jgi:hypothetical protein
LSDRWLTPQRPHAEEGPPSGCRQTPSGAKPPPGRLGRGARARTLLLARPPPGSCVARSGASELSIPPPPPWPPLVFVVAAAVGLVARPTAHMYDVRYVVGGSKLTLLLTLPPPPIAKNNNPCQKRASQARQAPTGPPMGGGPFLPSAGTARGLCPK